MRCAEIYLHRQYFRARLRRACVFRTQEATDPVKNMQINP